MMRKIVAECRTLADGRAALVGLVDDKGWWGAVSAGPRDFHFIGSTISTAGTRDERISAAMLQLEAGAAANWTASCAGEERMWDEAVIAMVVFDCDAAMAFMKICGRSTVDALVARRDPQITLAPLDAMVGFDAVERFYDRWPFLRPTFGYFMSVNAGVETNCDGMAADDEDAAFRLDADGARIMRERIAAAMAADRIDVVAENVLSVIGLFPNDWLDIGDVRSASRLLACWNGYRTCPASASALIALAHATPPDWLPKTWWDANRFAGVANWVEHRVATSKGVLKARTLISSAKGNWAEFGKRVERWSWDAAYEDVYDAFMRQVMWPALYHLVCPDAQRTASLLSQDVRDAVEAAGWRLLFGGKALPAMGEAVYDWHRRMDVMEESVGRVPETNWATPFTRFTIDSFVFEAIGGMRRLRNEGRILRHCVGSRRYVTRCKMRQSVIVSIGKIVRDDEVEPVSTVELTGWVSGEPWSPRIRQHRGKDNGHPADDVVAALDKAISVLASRVPPCRSRIDADPSLHHGDEIAASAGYDWMDKVRVENAIRQWAHFLPRDVAKGGLAWFRANVGAILGLPAEAGSLDASGCLE